MSQSTRTQDSAAHDGAAHDSAAHDGAAGAACDPATRVTKSLLGYGVIAGPVWVTVSLAQALTRDGFDLRRHEWSLLADGHLGWIQTANFILAGLMVLAAAAGLRRALGGWVPRLVAGYGLGLVGAGIFRADPARGFPVGTPDGPGTVSWHGMLHLVSAMIGFGCLIAACVVLARRRSVEGRRGWAAYSLGTGVVFLAGFAGVASGSASVAVNLAFTGAVLLAWAWVSAVSVDHYRSAN
jgi:hypothetical membrane protein